MLVLAFALLFPCMAYIGFEQAIDESASSSMNPDINVLRYIEINITPLNKVDLVYRCGSQIVTTLNVDTDEIIINPMFTQATSSNKPSDEYGQIKTAIVSSLSTFSITKLANFSKSLLSTDSGESITKVGVVSVVASLSGYYFGYHYGKNWLHYCDQPKLIEWIGDKKNWLLAKDELANIIGFDLTEKRPGDENAISLDNYSKVKKSLETKKFDSEYFILGASAWKEYWEKNNHNELMSLLLLLLLMLSVSITIIYGSFELIMHYKKHLQEKKQ